MAFSLFTNVVTEKTFEELKMANISHSYMDIPEGILIQILGYLQDLFNKRIIYLIIFFDSVNPKRIQNNLILKIIA